MTQITFEKLKENCICEFIFKDTHAASGVGHNNAGKMAIATLVEYKRTGRFPRHREFIKQIENDCIKVIESTDIRNLEPLIQTCPQSVPSWIKNKQFVVEFGDGGWTFYKK